MCQFHSWITIFLVYTYGTLKKIGKNKNNIQYDSLLKNSHFSDHPTTVKKRFFSVFIVMLISPLFIYLFSSRELLDHYTIWYMLGLRVDGLFSAFIYPLLLTVVLFLGPLSVQLTTGIWKIYSGMYMLSKSFFKKIF